MRYSDDDILRMLRDGEERGMTALFERYYRPLVVFADTFLHDWEEAEDLVQEQLVKLWEGKVFGRIVAGALGTFLFTAVRNGCVNWLEKKCLPLTSLDLPHYQIAQAEAERMDEEAARLVREAVAGLPERTRLVVEGVALEEMSYKEVAERLGVSVNTVKTLLRLGMKELRERMKGKEDWLVLWRWLVCRSGAEDGIMVGYKCMEQ